MPSPRIASRDAPNRHRATAHDSIFRNRVARVLRATRLETARRTIVIQRMNHRRDRRAIDAERSQSQHARRLIQPMADSHSRHSDFPALFLHPCGDIARRRGQFVVDCRTCQTASARARDYHDRYSRRYRRANSAAKDLAHTPLYAISHHRIADSTRYGHAQARAPRLVLQFACVEHEMCALDSHAETLQAQEFCASMQRVGAREAHRRATAD